jgi:flagellar hook-associated protein 2
MSETISNDYVSMINKKGSGYNIPVIVDAIVDAAMAPIKAIVNEQKDKVDTAITGMASLKSTMQISQTNVKTLMPKSPYALKVSPDTSYSRASVIDSSKVTAAANTLTDVSIASEMMFEYSGFATASDTMAAARTLTIKLGNYDNSGGLGSAGFDDFVHDNTVATTTVNVTTDTTLTELALLINSKPGVFAEVVQMTDVPSTFSLIVKGETGLKNAVNIVDDASGTDAGRFTSDSGAFSSKNQMRQFSKNADFKYNGLVVSREKNIVTDLIPGIQIDLLANKNDPQTITTTRSSSNIQSNVEGLIAELNAYKTDLKKLGFIDETGDENGFLANNAFLRTANQKLAKLIASPIKGYGDNNIYFAEFGVKTSRDGSYQFDKTAFDRTFLRNPEKFNALSSDTAYSSNPNVFVFSTTTSEIPQGKYTFTESGYVLNQGAADAKSLTKAGSSPAFTFTTTDYLGFSIGTTTDTPGDFSIYVGRSVKTMLSNFFAESLSKTGNHDATVQRYTDKITSLNEKLSKLDRRELLLQNRYTVQFSAMEEVVNSSTSSADFLTQMVDGWNKS